MSKLTHPNTTILKGKNKTKPSYWVTDCTQNIEFKYSYDEKTKTKIRQTQSC
jgi:hypothetical protein